MIRKGIPALAALLLCGCAMKQTQPMLVIENLAVHDLELRGVQMRGFIRMRVQFTDIKTGKLEQDIVADLRHGIPVSIAVGTVSDSSRITLTPWLTTRQCVRVDVALGRLPAQNATTPDICDSQSDWTSETHLHQIRLQRVAVQPAGAEAHAEHTAGGTTAFSISPRSRTRGNPSRPASSS